MSEEIVLILIGYGMGMISTLLGVAIYKLNAQGVTDDTD